MIKFLKQSKNNKRLINIKIKRIYKLDSFINSFKGKGKYYYHNMISLRDILAKTMNQKLDAKTIVFAVKMFGYSARNLFDFVAYPFEISIPIDSRLTKIFEKYNDQTEININTFYQNISKNLKIVPLHLD
jgi:DNA-(apurinic or apyrimidinic site) lyase